MDPNDGVQPRGDGEKRATPQPEDGFAPIANEVLWALSIYGSRMPRADTAWPILMHVFQNTYGQYDPSRRKAAKGFRNKIEFITTRGEISAGLFLENRTSNRALSSLVNYGLLIIEVLKSKQRKEILLIRFNKNYRSWKNFPAEIRWSGTTRSHRNGDTTKDGGAQDDSVGPHGPTDNSVGPHGPTGSFGQRASAANDGEDNNTVDRNFNWDHTVPLVGPHGPTESEIPEEKQLRSDPTIQEHTNQTNKKTNFRDEWGQSVEIAEEEGYTAFKDLETQWWGDYGTAVKTCENFVRRDHKSQRYAFKQFLALRDELREKNQLKFLPTKLPSVMSRLTAFADAYVPDSDQEWLYGP